MIAGKGDRLKPEFADASITLNVYMLRLIAVEAKKEKPIGTGDTSDSWHFQYPYEWTTERKATTIR